MEKFDQETREKKAATSTMVVIPPGSEAAKAPKETTPGGGIQLGSGSCGGQLGSSGRGPGVQLDSETSDQAGTGCISDGGKAGEAAERKDTAGETDAGARGRGSGDERPGAGTSSTEERT